ncbi:hypothetical protein B0T25DRAFT_623733 [Lasiosphaeria hispida]|uniref:NB-ARC domain-containing protein n=1 Tax=Lasiosphaeria hispida TaxID=260671 RepID=A0AAJ0HD37_9PEZI|nr:hypothetical protein B0T25DRAFT_623733 [Lasiosphaeria hispida]
MELSQLWLTIVLAGVTTVTYLSLSAKYKSRSTSKGISFRNKADAEGKIRRGLQQVYPALDRQDDTTIDIIAIHGLDTSAPGTWEYRYGEKGGGNSASTVVNWLSDDHMLPATVPNARIFTYNWRAEFSKDAVELTLRDHAEAFLLDLRAFREKKREPARRPVVFITSCFGGLVVVKALTIAASAGGKEYSFLRLATVGIAFLGTPFKGTPAERLAQLLVAYEGLMGEQASTTLIKDLKTSTGVLDDLVSQFMRETHQPGYYLPLHCFYEMHSTNLSRKILPEGLAKLAPMKEFLVNRESACLHGWGDTPLDCRHVMMNKFGPDTENFRRVASIIRMFVSESEETLKQRNVRQERHFMVPFGRNMDFVGRKPILEQLLERIPPSAMKDDCQRTAIEGLGGVGKTHIALEVAFRIGDAQPDCSVFWVPAVDATTFENAYRAIGQELKVPGIDEEKADIKALVKAALSHESVGSWLLIIDNADDTNLLFGDTALANYLPFSRKGSILCTTRNHRVAVKLVSYKSNIIPVEDMSRGEALELLETNLEGEQIHDTASNAALLDFLTNLPLAIRQASAFMAENRISTLRYLELYKSSDEDMAELLSQDFDDRHRYESIQNPIATTWLISFQQISDYDPLAADYLKFMCFLAGKNIPQPLLPAAGRLEAVRAIGTLKAYAFISQRNEPDTYDIHRLVQISMLRWLARKGEREEWTAKVLKRLADVFPSPKHENREEWMRYLPHTHHVLQLRERIYDKEATADLLSSVGEGFRNLGKYKEAKQMHRQALQLYEKVLGKEHPDTLNSMNNLASGLQSQGKYEEAEQMHQQALELRKKVLGKEHPNTLSSMNNLASVLRSQGKYEEAEQMHQQALELREKVLGKEHPNTLNSMSNLANVLHSQGKYEEAEQMHRQEFQLCEKVLGKEHPDTLNSMNNLANMLDSQGKYEEAEQMHRQTLQLRKKVLGKEHPDTLSSMNNLANVLQSQGKYEEAEQMHQQALELREKVLGKEHPNTLNSMNNLANVLHSQGKYEEAEQMHRQEFQLCEKVLGKEHPDTLNSMNNLANMLDGQGKYEEAEQMHRQTLQLRKKVLGKEHPDMLSSMNNLASVLRSQGKYEEAEQMHQQALELREKVLGKEHPDTLNSMNNLANVLQSQGKYEEAEQMHQQALELRKKVLGKEHPNTLNSMNNLANVLQSQGKYEEAEQMHQQALELRKKVLGKEHPNTLNSMNNLASVLRSQEKYEEAEQMHRQALEIQEKVLGKEHPNTLTSKNNLVACLGARK